MTNAVIYARFSSDRQNDASIDAQVRACKEYARQHDINIVGQYADEAISGKSTKNRAAYQKMMRDAKKQKFDTILIHKYDRISRNLADHVNLASKLNSLNIQLIAVAQDFGKNKEGKLMIGIQWILSEYYIDNLSEEVKKGHKELAIKGLHNGGFAPFGYDIVDKKYVINPIEANYVKQMYQCALNRQGFTDLLKEMNDNGITGKRGKPLRYSSIYEILRNEKYTGVYIYSPTEEKNRESRRTKPNAIRVEGAIPEIISRELWDKVQDILKEKKQKGVHHMNRSSGLVYCGECGAKMYSAKSSNKGHTYDYYVCSEHCGNHVIRIDVVEKMIDQFLEAMNVPQVRKDFTDLMNDYTRNEEQMLADFENMRKEKLNEKQVQLDNLVSNMASGLLSAEVMEVINDKIKDIKSEMDKISKLQPVRNYSIDTIEGFFNALISAKDEELARLIVDRVVVYKDQTAEVQSVLYRLLEENKKTHNESCGKVLVAGVRIEVLLAKLPQRYMFSRYSVG